MLELTTDTTVDIAQSSLAHGGGIFETVCVHRGVPLFLEAHLDRMSAGIRSLDMPSPPHIDQLRDFIARWLAEQNIRETALRLLAADGKLMVMQRESYVPPQSVAIGIATGFVRCRLSRLSGIKSANYLENRLLTRYANRDGLFDRIAPNDAGKLTDGGRCNVFLEKDGLLVTPEIADGALPGIVRNILIDQGVAGEQSLGPDDLESATAVLVTSSLAGALPVHRIENLTDPDPNHPLIKQAVETYGKAVAAEITAYSVV